MGEKVYRSRQPHKSKLWQCLNNHVEQFINEYPTKYEKEYGKLRPIIEEVVAKYLECGDLSKGFARVECSKCQERYLVSFSCKGRWFCPSCHQKKVLQFGEFIIQNVAYPVPHRQYVLTLPKMLRVYFRHDRAMIGKLFQIVYESVLLYIQKALGREDGQAGMVITLQSFGEYLNVHSHLHAIVADGLFTNQGLFYVMPRISTGWLEAIFRAKVITMLVKEGRLAKELGKKLMSWKNSGFSAHHGQPVKREDQQGLERLSQYIIRNPFSEEKMIYNQEKQQVIYHSKLSKKTKRNFEVFKVGEFIASITQHIPDKGMQLVRYYGWYSNKSRGMKKKQQNKEVDDFSSDKIININSYIPPQVATKQWRALIQKVWEVDPLECPSCGGEMRIISFIQEKDTIEKILRYLGLWKESIPTTKKPRGSPKALEEPAVTYEPFFDDCPNQVEVLN